MIGFAPAKNTFNNASFVKKISHLFAKIEIIIEQDVLYIAGFLFLAVLAIVAFVMFRHGETILAMLKGKKVIVVEDSDRVALANAVHETMDESAIKELQQMQLEMSDPHLHEVDSERRREEEEQSDTHDFHTTPVNILDF